jgi:hypothetical protein
MPFTASEIDQIIALLCGGGPAPEVLGAFRRRFPGRSLTRCDASDIEHEMPYRRMAHADLHLVDGREACWRFTGDPAIATGVVVAARPGDP